MNFISPSFDEVNLRKTLNKRVFFENLPLSFVQNGQGYFFLFCVLLVVYLIMRFTILRNSILLSSKIYRKQRWRYQMYLIHHKHIFPFFMSLFQVLMMKSLYFAMIDIQTTNDYKQTSSILSLVTIAIVGIAYLFIFLQLYYFQPSENNKIIKYFEYDLKSNNPYFFFLQCSIDMLTIVYHAVYAQDQKQQTIIIFLGFLVQSFFIIIQKPFIHWWENIIDFCMYGCFSSAFYIFQKTNQLTLTQLMDNSKQIMFNNYSNYFNYSLAIAIITAILSVSLRILKGLIRALIAFNSLRTLKDNDTMLWELEVIDTQKMVTEHKKSLLITDQQQINKGILKEILQSKYSKKELLATQHTQLITLSAKKPFKTSL